MYGFAVLAWGARSLRWFEEHCPNIAGSLPGCNGNTTQQATRAVHCFYHKSGFIILLFCCFIGI